MGRLPSRSPALFLLFLLCLPSLSQAQLDLGTGDVPQSQIDGYLGPFYRVIAAGLSQGRFAPGREGLGAEAGFQAGLVPLPDRDPFRTTSLSALPLFRLRAGGHWEGAALEARGMVWTDPRVGDLAAYGVGVQYGFALPAWGRSLRVDLEGGWDALDFASTYTYRYHGPFLGLGDQEVSGDDRLFEQVWGASLTLSARYGDWAPYAQAGFDRAVGRFAYLYIDPRDGNAHRVRSDLGFPTGHGALGLGWRGFRVEAAWGTYLALELGWSFRLSRS